MTLPDAVRPKAPVARDGMVYLSGGEFVMGSNRHYPEESPAHKVRVDGFWIDQTPVTNRNFLQFVAETEYVTFAEIASARPVQSPGAFSTSSSVVYIQHPMVMRTSILHRSRHRLCCPTLPGCQSGSKARLRFRVECGV